MSGKKRSPVRSPPPPPARVDETNDVEEFVLSSRPTRQNSQTLITPPKILASSALPSPGNSRSGSPSGEHTRSDSVKSRTGSIEGHRKRPLGSFRSNSSPAIDSEAVRTPGVSPIRSVEIPVSPRTSPLHPPLRFADMGNQWPALSSQVSQGLSTSLHLAEFFSHTPGVDNSPSSFDTNSNSNSISNSNTIENLIFVEEQQEQIRQRQLKLLISEQVGRPLMAFCNEAKERLSALITEEKELSKLLETTTSSLYTQKIECMSLWDELKTHDFSNNNRRNSGHESLASSAITASHRRISSSLSSSRVASSSSSAFDTSSSSHNNNNNNNNIINNKRLLDKTCKMFREYEMLLKKANIHNHRYVRDMTRLLNSLEEFERNRISTLNLHCQIYSQLKQKQTLTIRSPDLQIQDFLMSKFDVSERHALRFVSLTYDLPCSPEDLRDGRLISSSDTLLAINIAIASVINSPEVCTSSPLVPLTLSRSVSSTPFDLPTFLGYPGVIGRRRTVGSYHSSSLPARFDDREIGSLKRSRIGRLLLGIETDTDLPKLRTEESDHDGSGYLELMVAPSSWKLLYCTVKPGRLLLCAKKDAGTSVKFHTRAARFTRYGRSEVLMRPHCFCVYFPHSSQRLVFACKSELAVLDWLQALTRTAVTEKGIVGRSLVLPSLALGSGETTNLLERLDAIEKNIETIRDALTARDNLSDWVEPNSDDENDTDSPGHALSSQVIDSKHSELSFAVKESYLKAELHGYLDRILVGMVEHEPYMGMGAHHTWDLMSPIPRRYWVVLKIFLSKPGTLVRLLRSVIHRHKSIDRLARVVLNIALYTGTAVEILDALIEEEVSKTPFETQLFRTDSLSSKMWGFFAVAEGKTYLAKMLAKPVQACILDASASDAPAVDFELDPAKIAHVKSVHEPAKPRQDDPPLSPAVHSPTPRPSSHSISFSSSGSSHGSNHGSKDRDSMRDILSHGGSHQRTTSGGNISSITTTTSTAPAAIPHTTGTKAISWWAKKLHTPHPTISTSSDEKQEDMSTPPSPVGFRRVSVNTSTTTLSQASTSSLSSSSSSLSSTTTSTTTPTSLLRRLSATKRTSGSDEKENEVISLLTSPSSPLLPPSASFSGGGEGLESRRVSTSELPVFFPTRYATLEQSYFLRTQQNNLTSERKAPPGLPRSDSSAALPVKFEKPRALTAAVAKEDPTEFLRQAKVAQNLAHLEQCCVYFLSEITRSLDYCPRSLRLITHSVYKSASVTFPSARLAAVGGFFFLRFLCPQMLQVSWAPEVNSSMTTAARRNLLLVTKVLQFLANCASDEAMTREQVQTALAAKEASMMPLVDFVQTHAPKVSKFLQQLADPPDPRFLKNLVEPSAQVLEEQARDLDLDLEWFVTHVLATVINDEDDKADKMSRVLGVI